MKARQRKRALARRYRSQIYPWALAPGRFDFAQAMAAVNRLAPRMMMLYTLDDAGNPVPCADAVAWAMWIEAATEETAKRTEFDGGYVSTVFLGVDHNYSGQGAPILWETMIFMDAPGHPLANQRVRARTRDEALRQHEALLTAARTWQGELT